MCNKGGIMKILIISESAIIRVGLISILEEEKISTSINETSNYDDIDATDIDVIATDSNKSDLKYLLYLKQIKDEYSVKIIVLDFYENKNTFIKSIQYGLDVYILPNIDSENITWIFKQISKGKKYHDIESLEKLNIEKKYICKGILSERENEVANLVSKGKSNADIASDLCISINTVKKHITSILSKLNIKSRIEITIHILDSGIF